MAVLKVMEIEKNIFTNTKKIDITKSGANRNKTHLLMKTYQKTFILT